MTERRGPDDDEIVRHPHDGLAKRVFTHPEAAAVELRAVLPAALCERLDWSTLEVASSSFVDSELRARHSDILYSIALRGSGRRVSIYVVLEHQSTPDAKMPVRFLVYVGRFYERHLREHRDEATVPMVIPVLLYHGPSGWTLPRRLSEVLDAPPELLEAYPSPVELLFAVDDLSESVVGVQVTRDILARERGLALAEAARTLLWLALHPDASTGERATMLGTLLNFIAETLGPSEVQPFLTYLASAFESSSPVHGILAEPHNQETRRMFISLRDKLLADGEAKGMAKGEAKGMAKGMARSLERLLEAKGLELSSEQRERLNHCTDEGLLQRWFDRAVTAQAVAPIFED